MGEETSAIASGSEENDDECYWAPDIEEYGVSYHDR